MAPTCALGELAASLLSHVLSHQCASSFTPDDIAQAVHQVHRHGLAPGEGGKGIVEGTETDMVAEAGGAQGAGTVAGLVRVIRLLAEAARMEFSDVVGQVLWQHRRAKVLRSSPFRPVVEEMAWVDAAAGQLLPGASLGGLVADVFRAHTAAEGGRMRHNEWVRVVRLLEMSPVLRPRLKRSDIDRLFYVSTHRNGDSSTGIGCSDFKELLLELADAMHAHPAIVFLAVGSHAGSATS